VHMRQLLSHRDHLEATHASNGYAGFGYLFKLFSIFGANLATHNDTGAVFLTLVPGSYH
jgi:hypothetical protein